MLRHWKMESKLHVQNNIALYLIILFAILTGIASGLFTASSMSGIQKSALGSFLETFFQQYTILPFDKTSVFLKSLWQNIQSVFLIWLSGLFVFGIPFIILIVGMRSFFISFAISFIIGHYYFGGLLFTLLCILPQTLIYLLCYLIIGTLAMENALKRLKNRKFYHFREQKNRIYVIYTLKILIVFFLLTFGNVIEAFISPVFFGLFRWVFS
ncbi:MAG: stage II sporulation protein M [Clostridiales bacterium]|jgi:stage II sporulation protein M|nr:stage II sporulation protein M [Clostridiales bacterium]